jgi:hypothetical protein
MYIGTYDGMSSLSTPLYLLFPFLTMAADMRFLIVARLNSVMAHATISLDT